jgi:hypothetical protein
MLEESARKAGYHLVFRRRAELSQEENLKWASDLLDVKYDDNAKDITRVFFTTTEKELLFLDDEIFDNCALMTNTNNTNLTNEKCSVQPPIREDSADSCSEEKNDSHGEKTFPSDYHGIPFAQVLGAEQQRL